MATLSNKIGDTIQMLREAFPAEVGALLEQGAGEISALSIVENALTVGDTVPDFDLQKYGGGTGSLSDYLAKGPLVVTFYRGVWCPYCNLQLKEYSDRIKEITDLGAQLVALTPEKPGVLDTLKETGAPDEVIAGAVTSVDFDVLHDDASEISKKFGLVFDLPQSHQDVLKGLGVDLVAITGNDSFAFADPATYVIAPNGKITWAFVPNNYRKRAEVDAICKALTALKADA